MLLTKLFSISHILRPNSKDSLQYSLPCVTELIIHLGFDWLYLKNDWSSGYSIIPSEDFRKLI